jgi:hypothetical protein
MDQDGPVGLASLLAARHSEAVEPEPERSLLNYAESPRAGDWTMRSALVRFAQPEPVRAATLLALVRRLDAVLHHVARRLERRTVVCDRELGPEATADPVAPYPDTRGADLARLARLDPDGFPVMLAAYTADGELDHEEQVALPLLGVALELDDLAEVLASWAVDASDPPPTTAVDETCARVKALLDELGVPMETGPPRRA